MCTRRKRERKIQFIKNRIYGYFASILVEISNKLWKVDFKMLGLCKNVGYEVCICIDLIKSFKGIV